MSSDLDQLPIGKNMPEVLVINTRPAERATPLTHYLRESGMTVVDMPMLMLRPLVTTAKDITIMQQWLAGDYQALVVVSPTAATLGLAAWKNLKPVAADSHSSTTKQEDINVHVVKRVTNEAPSHIVAVGDATATVLRRDKQKIANHQVRQPLIANNEGMLAMPEIDDLQKGDKLLIWRGLGGLRLLVDTLSTRGVHIDSIAWYERVMPDDASENYQRWREQMLASATMSTSKPVSTSKPIVIISSGTAFEHWTSIVNQVQQNKANGNSQRLSDDPLWSNLNDFIYVVLGGRLADILTEQQLSYWRVEDLSPKTIASAIESNRHFFDNV